MKDSTSINPSSFGEKAESMTFLVMFYHRMTKNIRKKTVDLTLGYTKVSSANFIQILNLHFVRFLNYHSRKIVVIENIEGKIKLL